jgi:hypothetical protein
VGCKVVGIGRAIEHVAIVCLKVLFDILLEQSRFSNAFRSSDDKETCLPVNAMNEIPDIVHRDVGDVLVVPFK